MKRGECYRVYEPGGDPKLYRTFVVVSRQALIDSRFSTVIRAPVYSSGEELATQVAVGPEEGLKHCELDHVRQRGEPAQVRSNPLRGFPPCG